MPQESKAASAVLDEIEDLTRYYLANDMPVNKDDVNELMDWVVELDEANELIESRPEVLRRVEEVFGQE